MTQKPIEQIKLQCLVNVQGTSSIPQSDGSNSLQTVLHYAGKRVGVAHFSHNGHPEKTARYDLCLEDLHDDAQLLLTLTGKLQGIPFPKVYEQLSPADVFLDNLEIKKSEMLPGTGGYFPGDLIYRKHARYFGFFNTTWDVTFDENRKYPYDWFHNLHIPLTQQAYSQLDELLVDAPLVFSVDVALANPFEDRKKPNLTDKD